MSETAENKVVPIVPESNVIQLDTDDAKALAESASKMGELYAHIGQTTILHNRAIAQLTQELEEAEKEYGHLGKQLAKKYVKDRGQYMLDAEIGAFIGVKTPKPPGE